MSLSATDRWLRELRTLLLLLLLLLTLCLRVVRLSRFLPHVSAVSGGSAFVPAHLSSSMAGSGMVSCGC
eukprot:COSAG01_NODE_15_length_40797_cov_245.690550_23_plen_69_part_00